MSMSSDDTTNLAEPNSHSEWSLRVQCDRLNKELHSVKRHNQDLKNALDMVKKDYIHVREAQRHTQSQLNLAKSDMENLKAHASQVEGNNSMYQQQLMDAQQSHHGTVTKYESNEMLNRMIDTAVERYNSLKGEMDQLREVYRNLMDDNHKIKMMYNAKCEELSKVRADMGILRSQCTAVTQEWQSMGKENLELENTNKGMKQEIDKLSKDIVGVQKLKEQELTLVRREKEELSQDRDLVMLEREKVHKEIDMLTESLAQANSKVAQLEQERKHMSDIIVTYGQEIQSALHDRDQAQKHMRELRDCVGKVLKEPAPGHNMDTNLRNRLLEVSMQDRNEVNEERVSRGLTTPKYDTKELSTDVHSSKEAEMLKKENASLRKELAEAKNDANISIKRRDWAFSERDKIVQERESIRRQCDELRRERDRAVSNHAEELRTLDELKKFKLATSRELVEMREKLDKEERKNKLTAGSNSRDSAIDNDLQDWDTDILDYEIDTSNGYHGDLGLDVTFSGGNTSDSGLSVNSIAKGSPCEGKLRVNDVLLRVNDLDLSNASKERLVETIQASSDSVTFKVRRRKPIGRCNISVEFPFNRKDPGLQLESGIYVSKIAPGSALAREGNVAVGDRLLSVNGKSVESKSVKDVMRMLEPSSGDYVVMNVGKYGLVSSDTHHSSSEANLSNGLIDKVKSKFSRGNEKNISSKQHGIENGTGTSPRKKAQLGTKQLHNFLSKFKPRPSDEDNTIRARTDQVMNLLDKINQDYEGGSPHPIGTDRVDVSTNGTVIIKMPYNSKPAIPMSFADHSQVYRSRQASGEYINTPRSESNTGSSNYSASAHGAGERVLPGRTTPLYEPKVQTLPAHSMSRHIPAEVSEKSKSLEGHVNSHASRRDPDVGSSQLSHRALETTTEDKHFYHADSNAQSLDLAVKEMYDKHTAANKERKPRPSSLQPQFSGARCMTPNSDLARPMPSSPLRRNRPFTPESPLSHSTGHQDSRPSSVASQPASSRSNSSTQMFISAPSNVHRVLYPSCSSPPPPYNYAEKMHSSAHSDDRFHQRRESNASPVSSYQSQTLDRKFAPGSSHIHHAVPVRSSSNSDYSTARVKFPSNHSVSSNRRSINSNSLEIVSSGRSSPLSSPLAPEFYSRRSEEFISNKSGHQRSGKLKEGVLRELELDTSFEHLGITIEEQPGTGIFISSVSRNSLAADVGIEVGDQIIEFCGINMRTAIYDTAASVLKSWQSGDGKVIMKVQYNPRKCKHFPEQTGEVDKNSVTGSIQAIHAYMENVPCHKKPLYVVHSNGSSSDESRTDPPHNVTVQMITQNAGLKLCGGNETGVFVGEIASDSPFANSDLRIGHEILSVNGKSVKGATAEQVVTELNRPSETLTLFVQYNIQKYSVVHGSGGGDHFYVRAHFKYDAENATELSIIPGDLLLVENSLVDGEIGRWYVCKIDEKDGKSGSRGIVPSRVKMEEALSLRRSYSDVMPEEDAKTSKRTGSIGRRSFFKRLSARHQHQRSGSKDSRELTSFSDLSTSNDNVPIADDGVPLLYQRVEKVQSGCPRPVIILGPFAQALIQKLVQESPDKFQMDTEEYLNTENCVIEREIAGGVFVDYKKVNDLVQVTRTQTLRDIASQNRHSLLMVQPAAIERMHKCKLYPIVIFIRHKSPKQIKEVKDPRFLPEHLSSRSAKELFDHFSKIEVEYRNVFTVEVQGANMAAMHQNIKRVIDEEQRKHMWL